MQKTILIVSIMMMVGMVSAASQDLPNAGQTPGDAFYFFDRLSESLELAVAKAPIVGSSELEAKVRANHAAERLSEAQKLAEKNKSEKVGNLMAEYSEQINKSVQSAKKANNPDLSKRLGNVSSNHVKTLQEVEKKVPENAKKGVQNAIEKSQKNKKELGLPESAQNKGKTGSEKVVNLTNRPEKPVNKTVGRPEEKLDNLTSKLGKNSTKGSGNSSKPEKKVDNKEETVDETKETLENTTDNGSRITGKAIEKPTKPDLP